MKSEIREIKIIIMVVILTTIANGKTYSQPRVEFGPYAGIGISYLISTGAGNNIGGGIKGIGLEYHVGAIASIKINKLLCLMPSLSYARKGIDKQTNAIGIPGEKTDWNVKLNYLDCYLPLAFQLNKTVYLQVGLQGCILVNTDGYASPESGIIIDPKNYDNGLLLGTGFKLTSGLSFDLMMKIGFNSITLDSELHQDLNINQDQKLHYQSFILSTGVYYLIGHKKKHL